MNRTLQNTIAVLVITAFTALAMFGFVQLAARIAGVESTATAAEMGTYGYAGQSASGQNATGQDSAGSVQTCPATGCTASYCHAGR